MKVRLIAAAAAVALAPQSAWAQMSIADVGARLRAILDDNGDGTLTQAEYQSHFGSTSGLNTFDADMNGILNGPEFSMLIADGLEEIADYCDDGADGYFGDSEMSCVRPYID